MRGDIRIGPTSRQRRPRYSLGPAQAAPRSQAQPPPTFLPRHGERQRLGSVGPLLPHLGADLIAVAEHRLCGDQLLTVRQRLHRDGWTFIGTPALRGPGGRPSAGVALIAKRFLDFGAEGSCEESVADGRIVAATLGTAALGRIVFYAVYLHSACGLNHANIELVGRLLGHAAQHQLPWVALGDWNVDPHTMQGFFDAAARIAGSVRAPARVCAPAEPTYEADGARSCLDYAVVHAALWPLVGKARVLHHLPLSPHRPVSFALGTDLGTATPRVTIRHACPTLPPAPPIGPRRAPLRWAQAERAVEAARQACDAALAGDRQAGNALLECSWELWQRQASRELAGILEVPIERTQLLGRAGTFAPATVKRAYLTRTTKAPASSAAAFRWVSSRCQQISALARDAAGRAFAEDSVGAGAAVHALTALRSASRALARALTSRRQPAPLGSAFDPAAAAAWKAALLAVSQIASHAQPPRGYLVRLRAVTADLAAAAQALADVHARREQQEQTTRWRAWCQEALLARHIAT